ncbi:hypothetical protein [Cytobacillus sp. IB215316]|uniref:hypothetical protein n=1 Tax=Cytobacillus sp. IB215316 TaxID=3097354 RepID=UPI002A17411F|nr:hypothetical protein [Cytobacillus sp. IB215316]MDX8363350.1 hypothetical protein [Cytobacillus sp. IB215316]
MFMCPLCNGLGNFSVNCPVCGEGSEDRGRVMDYYDDYSPYMEIDHLKRNDGYGTTLSNHECPHILFCATCQHEFVSLIKEQENNII